MKIETIATLKPDSFLIDNELNSASAGTFQTIQSKQMSRDYHKAPWKADSKSLNPKEMTNEQLEEILRTGSIFLKSSSKAEMALDNCFRPTSSEDSRKDQVTGFEARKALGQGQKKLFTSSQDFSQLKFSNKLLETSICEKFGTPNRKPDLASSHLQYSSSKAYTSAMKALQEKVRQLERENAHYKEKERLSEEEQGRAQQRMLDEMQKCIEVEKKLRLELQSLEKDGSKQSEVLQRQIELLERDKERHIEQNSIEREQWRIEQNKMIVKQNEREAIIFYW